jgi:hypothetical protein
LWYCISPVWSSLSLLHLWLFSNNQILSNFRYLIFVSFFPALVTVAFFAGWVLQLQLV